jgi:hypothetical protein
MADETILAPAPIEPIKLKDALEERYFNYALSTILHRAARCARRVEARSPARALRHAAVAARSYGRVQEMRARRRSVNITRMAINRSTMR